MNPRLSAGNGAASSTPDAGSMTIIATVAVSVSPSERRGGRHTDHGAAKSSKSAALTVSRVRLPI